jgi:TolA-binding protein
MSIALMILFLRVKRSLRTAAVLLACFAICSTATDAQDSGLADQDYQLAAGYYQQSDWTNCAAAFEDFLGRYPDHKKSSEANFFLAESKIQLGNYADSLVAFQKFIEQNPKHRMAPRAMFRMGEAAYQLNKGKIALKSLELFIKKYPKHELVEYAMPYLGELRLGFNEPNLAQRAFSTALKIYPDSTLANQNRYGLAQSYRMMGKSNTAARYWKFLASDEDPEFSGLAKLQLGILACEQKKRDQAKPLLIDAELELPKDDVEHRIEASYWLGRIALEDGDFEKANSIFTSLESLPADENCGAGICYDAALAAWKTDRDDLAIEWLSKLRSTWPTNRLGARAMALEIDLLRERGLDVVALDYCNRYAERFPEDDLRFNIEETAGRIQYEQKKFAVGVATFEKLLADHTAKFEGDTTDPEQRTRRTPWLYLKGLCHIGLGEFETAIRDLRLAEANLVDPGSKPQIKLAIATSLFGQQLHQDAATEFESYLEVADTNDRANVVSALSRLVVCYGILNRWEDADEAVNVLLEGNRTTGLEAIQFLADHAKEKKRFDAATRYYQMLAAPDNTAPFRNHGLAGLSWLMMESIQPEANDVFRRLLNEYPDSQFSSQAAISRAKFLEEQNDQVGASLLYQSVVDKFPKFELSQIARLRLAWFSQQSDDVESLHRARKQIETFLEVAENSTQEDRESVSLISEALYQLGWVNEDLEDTQRSREAFEQLVASHPDSKYWPDAAYRVASSLLEDEEYEHSSAMVSRILKQETVPPEVKIQALYLQSKIAAASNRWDLVPELMEELIDSSDDKAVVATAKYWLAESLYHYGDFDRAGELLDEMQPEAAELGESLEPWLLLRLAQCHGKSQRWTNAALIARDCIDRFEDFSAAYEFNFLLGRAAEYDGMFSDARDQYQQVIDSTNGSGTETAAIAQWRIGETHFHQNEHKLAISAYFKTDSNYDFEKWSGAALIQAGKCQEHLENWQHAAKLYTQLIEQYPQSEFSVDANQRLNRVSQLATRPSNDTQTQTR